MRLELTGMEPLLASDIYGLHLYGLGDVVVSALGSAWYEVDSHTYFSLPEQHQE